MRWVLISWFFFALGCAPYVHSPPGRSLPLETSKTLHPRETGVQFEGGGGAGADIGVPGFTLRVRHGLVKHLDASAEFNFSSIRPDSSYRFEGANPFVFSGRIGVKYAIIDHVALTAGCAVGSWAGGGFVSPDLSLILAYENPYFIPFASAGGYTSHPFNEKLVALRDFDPPIDSFVGVPVLTWGWTASGGFRIPVIHDVKPRTTPPAVLLGFGFRGAIFDDGWDIAGAYATEGRRKELYFYGMVGFEYVFTPKRARAN